MSRRQISPSISPSDLTVDLAVKIFYRTFGHGPSKALLIIGLTGTHESWGPQIKGLTGTDKPNDEDDGIVSDDLGTGHGIEVCAFDNRGMGRSSVPTHKSEYTTTIMAKDLITLLDHVGWERAHIIGHSMGAMIACKLLLEAEPMHRFENGAEEMKEDVKADKDWLTEFEHNYWSDVLKEKEKLNEQETVEACSQQSDSLSVADYGWPNDLDQSQWDPSEMLDVDELLGDINDDVFTGWEALQIQIYLNIRHSIFKVGFRGYGLDCRRRSFMLYFHIKDRIIQLKRICNVKQTN